MGGDFSRFQFNFSGFQVPSSPPSTKALTQTQTDITCEAQQIQKLRRKQAPKRERRKQIKQQPVERSSGEHQQEQKQKARKKKRAFRLFDEKTEENTLANRSGVAAATHVAMWRLAIQLLSVGQQKRGFLIRTLRLTPRALQRLKRYYPSNAFLSTEDCKTTDLPCSTFISASPQSVQKPRRRVSFAPQIEIQKFAI